MLPSPSVQSLRASLVLTFHAFLLPTPKVLPRCWQGREVGCRGILVQDRGINIVGADASWLLRARRERPRGCCAAEQRDEIAPFHSITSSARARSVGSTSRPSALAVFRLIVRSYLVGACTGRLAGFSPLRTRL